VFDLTPQEASVLEGNDDLAVQSFPSGTWYSITMRTDTPPFDDPQVRKALRLAANRQEMIDLVLRGEGTVACDSIVWPGDPHRWEGECPQDIEQARELLAEAGYPDGLEFTLYTSNSFPPMVPMAEVYQQQAAEAGIDVTIEQVSPDRYWTEVWGIEPLFVDGFPLLPADFGLHLFYVGDGYENASYFDNAEFEQLLAEARATLDPEERTDLYQQAQQLLFEEGGTLISFHVTEMRAFHDSVSGIEPVTYYDLPWHTITKAEE
jgi:peptide/nickel transport system substrate-binding protein